MKTAMGGTRDDRGAVAVIVALLLLVVVGFSALVVDMGYLYAVRRQLQASADAAALAGAAKLLEGSTESEILGAAEVFAAKNDGKPGDGLTMHRGAPYTEVGADYVRVTVKKTSPLFFGQMFRSSQEVSATAEARRAYVIGMSNLVPIWVSASNEYRVVDDEGNPVEYALTFTNQAGVSGNWGALDFPPRGGGNAEFEKHMTEGYQGVIKVEADLDTETGQGFLNASKTIEAIRSRENSIVYVPVVTVSGPTGTDVVSVVSFAAFYLTEFDTDARPNVIRGHFLEYVLPTDYYQDTPPGGSSVYGETFRLVTPATELEE